jgi:ankyrin repeat protein
MNSDGSCSPRTKIKKDFDVLWENLSRDDRMCLIFNLLEGDIFNKLKDLTKRGEDVLKCDSYNMTLLHHASFSKNVDIVKKLIYIGCSVDCRDSEGRTSLHIAAQNKNYSILYHLIKNTKNCNIKDHFGKKYIDYLPLFQKILFSIFEKLV